MPYLTDLAQTVRTTGLKVDEVNGWRTRGHAPFTRVESVVCHHTAGPATGNMPSLNVVTHGRAGLAGPLCNLGLGRDGTVYVVAAGVAWHAGATRQSWQSNYRSIGIEAEATGVTTWPAVQMDAYARLCKALCDHYKIPVARVLGHKEVCTPPGRKIDPNFDMGAFRARIRNATATTDWFDMATKKDLREVIRAELADLPKDVWKYPIPATDGAPAQKVLRQASNSLQVSKRVRDIVRKRFNATDDQLDALMDELAALADQEDN